MRWLILASVDVFNTSLFTQAPDYNEIAGAVTRVCETQVGFDGLINVKIPWAQAKALASHDDQYRAYERQQDIQAKKTPKLSYKTDSALFRNLKRWADMSQNHYRPDSMHNEHINAINAYMTSISSFGTFYSRLKFVISRMEETNIRTNKVYYGYILDDPKISN